MDDGERARLIYNKIAGLYDEKRSNGLSSNELIEMPQVLRMLGDVKGRKILDAGCGTGQYCLILKEMGADILGIDISEENVKICKEKGLDVMVGDVRDIKFPDNSFDIVLSLLVVDYMEDMSGFLKEAHRILKPGGTLILSNLHPINTAGEWKAHGRRLSFEIDRYFDKRKITEKWFKVKSGKEISFQIYHRTLEEHFDCMIDAGFVIERFVEARPDDKVKNMNPRLFNKYSRVPGHLIFKLRKA